MFLAFAVGRDPLAVRADRQVEDPMVVAAQHGELPARGRVVQADLAVQADDQPPAIRQEERGEIPRVAAEDGDGPARGGIPQAGRTARPASRSAARPGCTTAIRPASHARARRPRFFPAAGSQRRMVLSAEPDARRLPSGL